MLSKQEPQTPALASSSLPVQDDLPSGVVTFLLTDVAGSSRLWDTAPSAMKAALVRHDALTHAVITEHRGVVVRPRGEGDSHFAVFRLASDAVAAARALLIAAHSEPWELAEPLRLHMALHTGQADVRSVDYYGSAVNRCARLRTLAYGGQILVSGTTRDLVRDAPDEMPSDSSFRDLGEYQLVGLARPERVFQLVVDGVASDFPPIRDPQTPTHNLVSPLDSFVGRDEELAYLEHQLLDTRVRLVTITGPGGVGKTRLALQLGSRLLHAFPDGVFFVSLSAVGEPRLVASAVASVVGVHESGDRSVTEALHAALRQRQQLLILDNFEHVLEAGAALVALMRACPGVKLLVTSREVLHVSGEHTYALAPLAVPNTRMPLDQLLRSHAVQLFVDRASAADPSFEVDETNASAVIDVCRRLEGLPLAIELVAARVRQAPVDTLNRYLAERQLPVLTGGPRDGPDRHRTLRQAIAWSYDLLSATEQALMQRLSVFAGGCTVEAAAEVCQLGPSTADALDKLGTLVEKSLLSSRPGTGGEPRFSMLETIRQFVLEQLDRAPASDAPRNAHAEYFLEVLEQAATKLRGPDEHVWLTRLGEDRDNLRAAMRFMLDHGRADSALRMANAAFPLFLVHGYTREGLRWTQEVLSRTNDIESPLRARTLLDAGVLAHHVGDLQEAEHLMETALGWARGASDDQLACRATGALAFVVSDRGGHARAVQLAEESLALASGIDKRATPRAWTRLAEFYARQGDVERGAAAAKRGISGAQELGDELCLAAALDILGLTLRLQGQAEAAAALLEEACRLHVKHGYKSNAAEALFRWADALVLSGSLNHAWDVCRQGLDLADQAGASRRLANGLRVAASVAAARKDFELALSLVRAAELTLARLEASPAPIEVDDMRAVLNRIQSSLDPAEYDRLHLGPPPPPEHAMTLVLYSPAALASAVRA